MFFLHELKQVFVLVKQFSFINRNVSLKQILHTCFNIFPFSCLQTEESSQSGPPTSEAKPPVRILLQWSRNSFLYAITIYHSQWHNWRGQRGELPPGKLNVKTGLPNI